MNIEQEFKMKPKEKIINSVSYGYIIIEISTKKGRLQMLPFDFEWLKGMEKMFYFSKLKFEYLKVILKLF